MIDAIRGMIDDGHARAPRRGACVTAALAVLLWGAPALSQESEPDRDGPEEAAPAAAEAESRPLVPGDAIRLHFWREPDLDGEFAVDEGGMVVLPILGRRTATDMPAGDLKRRLAADYGRQLRNQDVQITMLRRVTIFGAVNEPGVYFVDPTMKLAEAVALAGGSRREGRLTGVRLLRDGEVIESELDSSEPVLRTVRSGDQIFVPERSWFSRNSTVVVGGLISAVGIFIAAVAR